MMRQSDSRLFTPSLFAASCLVSHDPPLSLCSASHDIHLRPLFHRRPPIHDAPAPLACLLEGLLLAKDPLLNRLRDFVRRSPPCLVSFPAFRRS
jgi:hypothetical protein